MFYFVKALPKLGTPFVIGRKKKSSYQIYLAFKILNHRASVPEEVSKST
jgi:hypothetical protein